MGRLVAGISWRHGDACNDAEIRCRKGARGVPGRKMVSLIDAQRYKLLESTYVRGIRDAERAKRRAYATRP